ncbi:MAG: bifunctional DNA primase/polymerase [Proteobacteria bacterium]|nr:bifunctional DNA primase/polymerase [Pseudomonadota bacterium]
MLNHAIEYLEMGFSVIPVKRSDKKPYIKWSEYQDRHPTHEEIERWWSAWPDANVAVICGKISGIFVIDADGPKGIDWINAHLPKTGVYSITGKGIHAVFKIPEGVTIKNAVRLAPEVDIRGEGGYFIVPPSIHENGHKYQWRFIMDGWDDLLEFDPYTKVQGNLGLDLTMAKTLPVNEPVTEGMRNDTLAKLAGSWISKGLDDEEVIILAKAWNENNTPPLDEKELIRTVKSIRKRHQTHHPIVIPETESEKGGGKNIPDTLLSPSGVLQEIMDYIEVNSTVSVPIFSLAAAIITLGTVIGQKVQTETGLRTNIYGIVLGYSGTGKNAPFNSIPQLLLRTDAARTLGPTELTSSTSILKWLADADQKICMLMLDEIGLVLKGLKTPNSSAADIPRLLTKLFSSTDRPETKSYANGDILTVPWHNLSLFGASTPERFWEAITPGEVSDGFLARVLVFESLHDAPFPKGITAFHENPMLVENINKLYNIRVDIDHNRGNLVNIPIPKIIPRSIKAQELLNQYQKKWHELKNENKTDAISSIYGRCGEHAAKLSLIHAVSLDRENTKEVSFDSIKWACELVEHLSEHLIEQIQNNVADTEIHRWKQKILKSIREASFKNRNKYFGATIRDLQRGSCRGILVSELKKFLDSLILSEEIGAGEYTASNGRKVSYYYMAKK